MKHCLGHCNCMETTHSSGTHVPDWGNEPTMIKLPATNWQSVSPPESFTKDLDTAHAAVTAC